MENAKINKFKCDILSDFLTMCPKSKQMAPSECFWLTIFPSLVENILDFNYCPSSSYSIDGFSKEYFVFAESWNQSWQDFRLWKSLKIMPGGISSFLGDIRHCFDPSQWSWGGGHPDYASSHTHPCLTEKQRSHFCVEGQRFAAAAASLHGRSLTRHFTTRQNTLQITWSQWLKNPIKMCFTLNYRLKKYHFQLFFSKYIWIFTPKIIVRLVLKLFLACQKKK